MLSSLRSRLVGAFGLVILLMVLLSGSLSIWAMTSRFDILVTDESRQRARELAPLLEASYALQGDWRELQNLINITPADVYDDVWYDTEWWGVAATALQMDADRLAELATEAGSIVAVAEAQGVDSNDLVHAIVEHERPRIEAAVAAGEMTTAQAEDESMTIEENADAYIRDESAVLDALLPDWDSIIAEKLGMSREAVNTATQAGQSIAELAIERGVAPNRIISAIVEAEAAAMLQSGMLTDREMELDLADVISQAHTKVESKEQYTTIDENEASWFFGRLLVGDERLLVTDHNGRVIFDSSGTYVNEVLPATMLAKGISLWDYANNTPAGTAIVTAGPSYYSAHQSSFLRNVTWSLAVSALTAGIVALLVGLIIAQRITAPVMALTEATRHLAEGDWATRLTVRADGELGQMSSAFNAMAEELEKQRALRRQLVDDIMHEINTPLSVIQLELEALKDGMQSPEEATTQVRRETEFLRNLVDDLSLLAETDKGTLKLDMEPTDLVGLTAEAVARWHSQAEATGVQLRMAPAEPLPLVQADPLRLAQVLGNLISNALRYTPRGGYIEVKCQKLTNEDGHFLLTTVRDSGEGIPSTDLPHVFDRHYRAGTPGGRRRTGRGLGLAIVQQIVEHHGGRVWAESQPGEGSTFCYTLPLDPSGEPRQLRDLVH